MILGLLPAKVSSAQNAVPFSDPDDSQLWTAVQLALPLRERTQLILSGSFRLGRNFSHPVYETGGASLRFRLGRYFALSPIYQFVATQYYPGIHTRENRLSINGVVSVPIKRLVLDNMHQFEQRFRELREFKPLPNSCAVGMAIPASRRRLSVVLLGRSVLRLGPSRLESQSLCCRRLESA